MGDDGGLVAGGQARLHGLGLSRNRTLGEQLGAGRTPAQITAQTRTVAEGVGTAHTVHELAERHGLEMPVCNEVYRVLTGEIHASQAYRGLTP